MAPKITIIKAKDYSTRSELEKYIATVTELTPIEKTDFEIRGSEEEMARLQLSDRTMFWGIVCTIPGKKREKKVVSDVFRGKQRDFGIDGRIIKNPHN